MEVRERPIVRDRRTQREKRFRSCLERTQWPTKVRLEKEQFLGPIRETISAAKRRQRASSSSSSSESVVSIVRRRRIHRRVTPKQRVPTKKSAILAGKVGIGVIFGQNRQVSGRVRSFAKKPALQHRRRHRQEEPNFVIFETHVVKEKSRGCVTPIWKFRQRFCGKSQQR